MVQLPPFVAAEPIKRYTGILAKNNYTSQGPSLNRIYHDPVHDVNPVAGPNSTLQGVVYSASCTGAIPLCGIIMYLSMSSPTTPPCGTYRGKLCGDLHFQFVK